MKSKFFKTILILFSINVCLIECFPQKKSMSLVNGIKNILKEIATGNKLGQDEKKTTTQAIDQKEIIRIMWKIYKNNPKDIVYGKKKQPDRLIG
jgi:hypothetical protein